MGDFLTKHCTSRWFPPSPLALRPPTPALLLSWGSAERNVGLGRVLLTVSAAQDREEGHLGPVAARFWMRWSDRTFALTRLTAPVNNSSKSES